MNCSKSKDQKQKEAQEHKDIILQLERRTPAGRRREEQYRAIREAAITSITKIDSRLLKFEKYRKLIALGYAAFLFCLPSTVLAASRSTGGIAILKLMQMGSFWVGLGVVIWGIVEAQLDLPGWKSRITKGILGYIAILLVPMLFITLRDNLQIDVWQQLQ